MKNNKVKYDLQEQLPKDYSELVSIFVKSIETAEQKKLVVA